MKNEMTPVVTTSAGDLELLPLLQCTACGEIIDPAPGCNMTCECLAASGIPKEDVGDRPALRPINGVQCPRCYQYILDSSIEDHLANHDEYREMMCALDLGTSPELQGEIKEMKYWVQKTYESCEGCVSSVYDAVLLPTTSKQSRLALEYLTTHVDEARRRLPHLRISPVRVSEEIPGDFIVTVNEVDYAHGLGYNAHVREDPHLYILTGDPLYYNPTEGRRRMIREIINGVPRPRTELHQAPADVDIDVWA